eukprot:14178457-Alexandrium_andersonii.AAC.1
MGATAQCATAFAVAHRLFAWALRRSVPQHSPWRTVFFWLRAAKARERGPVCQRTGLPEDRSARGP